MSKIDFLITWVNGNDPVWQNEKKQYTTNRDQDDGEGRYRDMNLLKFWFRSVERNAPWVNKIFFVTWGHYPDWLNLDHPKLRIVKHSDFIPAKYLPTFSSHPIEFNLYRIHELSETFVYFNDDMFITKKVSPKDFFIDGIPLDAAILNAFSFSDIKRRTTDIILANDMYVINRHFLKSHVINSNITKWFSFKYKKYLLTNILLYAWPLFTGIKPMHMPSSLLKSTFNEVWDVEYPLLDATCSHRFRDINDVNPWLLQFWQIMKGKFYPRRIDDMKYFALSPSDEQNKELYTALLNEKYKLICINDGNAGRNYDTVKEKLNRIVYQKYKEPCSFEKNKS